MNKNPKISVIMPIYNAEPYLKEAIESILNQTYDDFEFIIINDGSEDKSLDIIKQYSKLDKRIKIVSRENKGLIYSLNEGISISSGEFIARMDGDDISMPDRFEKQINFFSNNDIGILGTLVNVFGDGDAKRKEFSNEFLNWDPNDTDIEWMLLKGYSICHPSLMIKKDILRKLNGYNYNYLYAEDYDLILRALKNNIFINIIQEVLLSYRIYNNNKSVIDSDKNQTLSDIINIRLDYMQDDFFKRSLKYLIWGASNGGIATRKIIEERFKNLTCKGYIDSFKTGHIENYQIYNPKDINILDYDYIFIATTPGKNEAERYLLNLGLKKKFDFICTV